MSSKVYKLKSKVWIFVGGTKKGTKLGQTIGKWHFITLPKETAQEIKATYGKRARGWGSLPVTTTIGKSTWNSSIFPDSKTGTYILPLKLAVRKAERIASGDVVAFQLTVRL